MRDFYNFEVGDIFIYAGGSSLASAPESTVGWLTRIEVTDITLFSDSVRVEYSNATKSSTGILNPTTENSYSENNTMTVIYNNRSLQGLIPGMISYVIDTVNLLPGNSFFLITNPLRQGYEVIETEHNDRQGISVGGFTADFENYDFSPETDQVEIAYPPGIESHAKFLTCEEIEEFENFLLNDSIIISNDSYNEQCNTYTEYTEGLGITCFYDDCNFPFFTYQNQTFMIGYKKGEEEYGNLFTIGEVLDTRELLTEAEVQLFPNPAISSITISIPDRYTNSFNVSITNISGKRVLDRTGITNNSSIDIGKLSPGIYILMGTNDKFTFTQKLVVE